MFEPLDNDVVQQYAEAFGRGDKFPAIVIAKTNQRHEAGSSRWRVRGRVRARYADRGISDEAVYAALVAPELVSRSGWRGLTYRHRGPVSVFVDAGRHAVLGAYPRFPANRRVKGWQPQYGTADASDGSW